VPSSESAWLRRSAPTLGPRDHLRLGQHQPLRVVDAAAAPDAAAVADGGATFVPADRVLLTPKKLQKIKGESLLKRKHIGIRNRHINSRAWHDNGTVHPQGITHGTTQIQRETRGPHIRALRISNDAHALQKRHGKCQQKNGNKGRRTAGPLNDSQSVEICNPILCSRPSSVEQDGETAPG